MAPKARAAERRVDPDDGRAYTFEELAAFYKGKFTQSAVLSYWDAQCMPVASGGRAAGKAGAKAKAKAAAAAQAEQEVARKPVSPEAVLQRITSCKVVPVVTMEDLSHAVPLAEALRDGGIDVVEITFRTPCAAEAIREVCRSVEGVCVGAGTVLTPHQVDEAIDGGADFIVSPGFDAAVAKRCRARGALYLPGVATPTEVMMASSRSKLKVVKFFPASNFGGVGTLKSYAAVFPGISFMPTGGVTESNLGSFVSLANVIAAGGTWMVAAAAIRAAAESGDWSGITDGARKASEAAHAGTKA